MTPSAHYAEHRAYVTPNVEHRVRCLRNPLSGLDHTGTQVFYRSRDRLLLLLEILSEADASRVKRRVLIA